MQTYAKQLERLTTAFGCAMTGSKRIGSADAVRARELANKKLPSRIRKLFLEALAKAEARRAAKPDDSKDATQNGGTHGN